MSNEPALPELTEKEYWEAWLGDKESKLSKDLIKIRETVKMKYADPQDIALPFYTPHGIDHCQKVEDLMHRLIPKKKYERLKEIERFYLLASAWLHDIGMLRSVSKEVWSKELDPSEIRKQHHITAHRHITNKFYDYGIEEIHRSFIAKLCRFHRKQEDINKCDGELLVGNIKINLRLLAAYLRLADALQIDSSRTPASAYAICLAYDIPAEAKLHWIKSKLVAGIHIDAEKHLITVQFQIPNADQLRDSNVDPVWVRYKIDSVINHVMDDLKDELSSVMYVLTRAGITYYLDIEKTESDNYIDDQTMNDLLGLVMNYDILVAPSASKLLEMILITIANISGFHLKKDEKPLKFSDIINKKKLADDINEFLNKVELNILAKRSCHLGLKKLLIKCKRFASDYLPNNINGFTAQIDKLFQNHHGIRRAIRSHSQSFFGGLVENSIQHDAVPSFNILLFGYSELVIKALCGFRDYLLRKQVNTNVKPKSLYNSDLEETISERFRIFVCEGQAKTQTAPGDRLLYHDGYSYALALTKRRFSNIVLVPDIVVGNIIENNDINLVMVGANGFTINCFKHSAGHCTVINLIKEYNNKHQSKQSISPKVVLVVSSDKWSDVKVDESTSDSCDRNCTSSDKVNIEGFWFWKGNGKTRDNIWLTRDKNIYEEIQKNYSKIMFYNPREDVVPIEYLDFIISDVGYFPIDSTDKSIIQTNIDAFFSKLPKEDIGNKIREKAKSKRKNR